MSLPYARMQWEHDQQVATHPYPSSPQQLGQPARTPKPSAHLVRRHRLRAVRSEAA